MSIKAVSEFVALRLLSIVAVLLGAVTVSFLIIWLIPGDPVEIMLGTNSAVTDEQRLEIRARLGLDLPWWQQYLNYLSQLFRLDFGYSYQLRQPVVTVLAKQLGPTIGLALAAIVITVLLLGIAVLLERIFKISSLLNFLELIAVSAPVFWTGLLLATVFSYQLKLLPIAASSGIPALILPGLAIALPVAASLSQLLRQALAEAEQQSFALTAKARGAAALNLLSNHSLRHASGSVLPLSAYLFGNLLAGAVVVETMFARPGLGRVTLDAVLARDLPVIMALVVFSGLVFVLINLLADLAVLLLDPRKLQTRRSSFA